MTYRPNIGVIGMGFVGGAVAQGFGLHANVKAYDKFHDAYDSLDHTVNGSDFLFICVPTPTTSEGQDLSAIHDALASINKVAVKSKIILIKSTALPGTTRQLSDKYPDHQFVYNPEFLTERNARLDFINTCRIVLGHNDTVMLRNVVAMYRARFRYTPIYLTSWEGAEMVKYMANGFLAMKVSFMNEMFDLAGILNVDWDTLVKMFLAEGVIGNSHTDVPGHDGKRGYGGSCFPKDVKAFIKLGQKLGQEMTMMKAADEANGRVRNLTHEGERND